MTTSAATVEFDHAAKSYPGSDEPAIRDLSLEVPPGKLTIFIGPSGSGKTTAMRLVNRMIELGLRGVEFIAINTDAQALLMSDADLKLLYVFPTGRFGDVIFQFPE